MYGTTTIAALHDFPAGTLAVDKETGYAYRLCWVTGGTQVSEITDNGASAFRHPYNLENELGNRRLNVVYMPHD